MLKKVTIFGSTGSIGVNTLEVISLHPDKFSVFALAGYSNADLLAQQCKRWHPEFAFIRADLQDELQRQLNADGVKTQVLSSQQDLINLAKSPDYEIAVCAIVGSFGIISTYHATASGKKILLANKESLVMAGDIIMNTAKSSGAKIFPVDSEHSAIYQAIKNPDCSLAENNVKRLILTASGGPLYKLSQEEMMLVTKEQALQHPVWSMGAKISIDSATLMNKGLELIEAYWLFGAKVEQLHAIIHPQHIIHSMVEYIDGSILAQMSVPDMKLPIAYALALSSAGDCEREAVPLTRIKSGIADLNFMTNNRLDFIDIDYKKFPCLQLALEALRIGGSASLVVSVANEIAVAKFLQDQILFWQIPQLIGEVLNKFNNQLVTNIEDVLRLTEEIYKSQGEM